MKRRLLFAAAQSYHPAMEIDCRHVGWRAPPVIVARGIGGHDFDQAIVGRVDEGVVVAFRGSLPPFAPASDDGLAVLLDWLNDGLSLCIATRDYPGGVHLGFAQSLRRLCEDEGACDGLIRAVDAAFAAGAKRHLYVSGHSKGGALANLFAWRAATHGQWRDIGVSVATIAAARAGNAEFARGYAASRIACLRYELPQDLVPHLPPGPETPRWLRAMAAKIDARLESALFAPVGLRVSAGGHRRWEGARPRSGGRAAHRDRRGNGLARFLPDVLTAHSIAPGSGYDRLVCLGEGGCTHGR